jgi:hypothetical protein
MAAEAAAATDYAAGLRTRRHDPTLHELIENNLKRALELWYHAGQLAAMPQLLGAYRALRPAVRPDLATLPGGARFDPWCLTDRMTLERWQRDPRAAQEIRELWQWDPDPAATMALKAEIDGALQSGDVVPLAARGTGTCYFECPWSALYEVRRPVRIGGFSCGCCSSSRWRRRPTTWGGGCRSGVAWCWGRSAAPRRSTTATRTAATDSHVGPSAAAGAGAPHRGVADRGRSRRPSWPLDRPFTSATERGHVIYFGRLGWPMRSAA